MQAETRDLDGRFDNSVPIGALKNTTQTRRALATKQEAAILISQLMSDPEFAQDFGIDPNGPVAEKMNRSLSSFKQMAGLSSGDEPTSADIEKMKMGGEDPLPLSTRMSPVYWANFIKPISSEKGMSLGERGSEFLQKPQEGARIMSPEELGKLTGMLALAKEQMAEMIDTAVASVRDDGGEPSEAGPPLSRGNSDLAFAKQWGNYLKTSMALIQARQGLLHQGIDTSEFDEVIEKTNVLSPVWMAKRTDDLQTKKIFIAHQMGSIQADLAEEIERLLKDIGDRKDMESGRETYMAINISEANDAVPGWSIHGNQFVFELEDDSILKDYDLSRFEPPEGKRLLHPDLPVIFARLEGYREDSGIFQKYPIPDCFFVNEGSNKTCANPITMVEDYLAEVHKQSISVENIPSLFSRIFKKKDEGDAPEGLSALEKNVWNNIKDYKPIGQFYAKAGTVPQCVTDQWFEEMGIKESRHEELFSPYAEVVGAFLGEKKREEKLRAGQREEELDQENVDQKLDDSQQINNNASSRKQRHSL